MSTKRHFNPSLEVIVRIDHSTFSMTRELAGDCVGSRLMFYNYQ